MVYAGKRVSRRKLDRLELNEYQAGLLSRGVQHRMDETEVYNSIVETSIGYAGAVGITAFDEIACLTDQVRKE